MNFRHLLNALLITLTLLYPVGVYFGLQYIQPRYLTLLLVALFILRTLLSPDNSKQKGQQFAMLITLGLFALVVFFSNSKTGLLFYPVLINIVMLLLFAYSLASPPTMIERLARLKNPQLPAEAIPYTRKVTLVWCMFFILNAAAATYTALFSSTAIWTLYNGFIAYLLIASLFIGELIVRHSVKKKIHKPC